MKTECQAHQALASTPPRKATKGAWAAPSKRGPKPKFGAAMKNRCIRLTNADWTDVLLIGLDRLRNLVRTDAKAKRRIDKKTTSQKNHNEPNQSL
jgi:hypothetical protein